MAPAGGTSGMPAGGIARVSRVPTGPRFLEVAVVSDVAGMAGKEGTKEHLLK